MVMSVQSPSSSRQPAAAQSSTGYESPSANWSHARRASAQSEQSFYSAHDAPSPRRRRQPRVALHPEDQQPSFSFVCLGTGGGPLEGDCSCYLLKPADAEWQDGSIVVEGGSWLGALTDVLEQHGPDSAFYDFDFPASIHSSSLRAGLMASFSQAFLISHAHLDHILGLVLGSASLPGKRAVYGLKPTLENILDMFNGKIWPKLASWKEDEPYTMYHMRSLENQRPHTVHPTLTVLPFALSHGLNPSVPPAPPTPTYTPAPMNNSYFSKRNSLPLSTQMASFQLSRSVDERARALDNAAHASERGDTTHLASLRQPTFNSPFVPFTKPSNGSRTPVEFPPSKKGEPVSPRAAAAAASASAKATGDASSPTDSVEVSPAPDAEAGGNKARRPRTAQGSERTPMSSSGLAGPRQPPRRVSIDRSPPSLDSTAFFITHSGHDRDVLFFGDVEPDCVSKSPRNRQVWSHAAERFAEGKLSAIFLECSFPKNHPTALLYGHLSVEHLFDELRVLAQMVKRYRERSRPSSNTSGRDAGGGSSTGSLGRQIGGYSHHHLAPSPLGSSTVSLHSETIDEHATEASVYDRDAELKGQLAGLGVIIIHVKPALFPTFLQDPDTTRSTTPNSSAAPSTDEAGHGHGTDEDSTPLAENEGGDAASQDTNLLVDPRTAPQKILEELNGEEVSAGLGVRFVMAEKGMRIEC